MKFSSLTIALTSVFSAFLSVSVSAKSSSDVSCLFDDRPANSVVVASLSNRSGCPDTIYTQNALRYVVLDKNDSNDFYNRVLACPGYLTSIPSGWEVAGQTTTTSTTCSVHGPLAFPTAQKRTILIRTGGVSPTPAPTPGSSQPVVFVDEQTDVSGKLKVALFKRRSDVKKRTHENLRIRVPNDYVVIGGGVIGDNTVNGQLITSSHPDAALKTWLLSTKDHSAADNEHIYGYAIGLKVDGLSRDQLRAHIDVNFEVSGRGPYPSAIVKVSPNQVLIGGGVHVDWTGAGNLVTATYPIDKFNWQAKSKDHLHASHARIFSYAIGIDQYIPGVGAIETHINTKRSSYASHPSASSNVEDGFVLSGCGAKVNWSGWGNLLWKISPSNDKLDACTASSKDHGYVSPATVDGYSIGMRLIAE